MNILMFTNTFTPHVGGVARSVEAFAREYRRRGHRVMVVAPQFEGQPADEEDVVRVPAMQRFNGSDFAVVLPLAAALKRQLDRFGADIVHSHHPFLLGNTATRTAHRLQLPLVFTHHTMYEQYTHYVPADSPALKRFVIELATCYANSCDRVFAPSESIAALLRERGVAAPVVVVPTGVDCTRLASGNAAAFRTARGIPPAVPVVGHVGRLAAEKNLEFLGECLVAYLERVPQAHALIVGVGPQREALLGAFERRGLGARVHAEGILDSGDLASAYAAMDAFAFTSHSETQGMVLAEAMAAGTPVVALDASGVREVVRDRENGRLLGGQDLQDFVAALQWVTGRSDPQRDALRLACRATGARFSLEHCADSALEQYEELCAAPPYRSKDNRRWARIAQRIDAEWKILGAELHAVGAAAGLPVHAAGDASGSR